MREPQPHHPLPPWLAQYIFPRVRGPQKRFVWARSQNQKSLFSWKLESGLWPYGCGIEAARPPTEVWEPQSTKGDAIIFCILFSSCVGAAVRIKISSLVTFCTFCHSLIPSSLSSAVSPSFSSQICCFRAAFCRCQL